MQQSLVWLSPIPRQDGSPYRPWAPSTAVHLTEFKQSQLRVLMTHILASSNSYATYGESVHKMSPALFVLMVGMCGHQSLELLHKCCSISAARCLFDSWQ